jgi:hypothetical protein
MRRFAACGAHYFMTSLHIISSVTIDYYISISRAGGVRRINIPPNMAFVDGVGDDKPGPMPYGKGGLGRL